MKLDLHIHSKHSFDSDTDVEDIITNARKAGLDAIAICDHDTMSSYGVARENTDGITVIPAMEITVTGSAHIIGLFLNEEIVSRNIFDVIDEIHEQDGLVMIPHPFRPGTGLIFNREKRDYFSGEEMVKILTGVDLFEAVNYRCKADENINTDKYISLYPDKMQTAGSDAHFPHEIGKAYVELEEVKSNSLSDIKDALLHSPRTIRYEVYSEDVGWEVKKAVIKGRKMSLIIKTKNLVPEVIRRSLRTIYEKSASALMNVRTKKGKQKVQ